MNHTLSYTDQLFTCPACSWRAVLTSDGRIVQTEHGDPGHDHIGQAQALRDTELADMAQAFGAAQIAQWRAEERRRRQVKAGRVEDLKRKMGQVK